MFKFVSIGLTHAEGDTRLEAVVAVLSQLSHAELLALEAAIEREQRERVRSELLTTIGGGT